MAPCGGQTRNTWKQFLHKQTEIIIMWYLTPWPRLQLGLGLCLGLGLQLAAWLHLDPLLLSFCNKARIQFAFILGALRVFPVVWNISVVWWTACGLVDSTTRVSVGTALMENCLAGRMMELPHLKKCFQRRHLINPGHLQFFLMEECLWFPADPSPAQDHLLLFFHSGCNLTRWMMKDFPWRFGGNLCGLVSQEPGHKTSLMLEKLQYEFFACGVGDGGWLHERFLF